MNSNRSGHLLVCRQRRSSASLRLLAIMLAATMLAGCGTDDISDLQSYVTDVKSRSKGAVEPLPVVKIVEPFAFPATQLRDPFTRGQRSDEAVDIGPTSGIRPDLSRPKEELESYELDSLRMVGTVQVRGGQWGLVKAPDGTIHRVRTGNYMGRNFGKIVQIANNRIDLLEVVPDRPGSWQERPAALEMADSGANEAGRSTR
ncbi:MAG: pilus assembly protein PilP [Methylotetracoccus sp.]